MKITTLGLDLAKTVFHLVGLDEKGHEVMKKKVSRKDLATTIQTIPPCRIAMESCGSASFWGRKFQGMGHTVFLIPPQYVKRDSLRQPEDDGDQAGERDRGLARRL
jgi:transposase